LPKLLGLDPGLGTTGWGLIHVEGNRLSHIANGQMSYGILKGWWTDAGTFESLLRASRLVAEGGANKVG